MDAWLKRILSRPTEVIALITMLIVGAGMLGFTRPSLADALAKLDTRITRNEARVDTLSTDTRFLEYLMCVQMRESNPNLLPPDCQQVIIRHPHNSLP